MSDELRASDDERERAVARLREASAEGRLTLEELAARTGDAYTARTRGELVRVTADLPAAAPTSPPARAREWPRVVLGLFVPVVRRKRRRLGRRTVVLTVFAPIALDLRSATFEHEHASITVLSLFAPVTVVVPEHVDVDFGVLGVFAPVDEQGSPGALAPAAPRLRVSGVSLFAPVFLRYRRS